MHGVGICIPMRPSYNVIQDRFTDMSQAHVSRTHALPCIPWNSGTRAALVRRLTNPASTPT